MNIKPYSILYSICLAILLMAASIGLKEFLVPVLPESEAPDTYQLQHLLLAADWKSHHVLNVDTRDLEFFAQVLPDLRQIRGVTIKGKAVSGQHLLQVINQLLDHPSVSYLDIQSPVTIPYGWTKSYTLKVLKLDEARLEGFGQIYHLLPNLEVLSWTNANLDVCPMPTSKLYHLRKLNISGNQLKSLPFSLSMYPNLRELMVDDNPITSLRPTLKYKRLTKLSAQRLQLDTAFIDTLPPLSTKTVLPYLYQLSLKGNQLQDLPDFLRYCPSLTELDVSNNPLKGDASVLCDLTQLKLLHATETALQEIPCTTARIVTSCDSLQ